MRRTLRLFASVKPARYLEPGNPTGLAGISTHSSPRSTLIYLYSRTLDKLEKIPESSMYRQSVEALTKHRLAIVEAAQPPGYEEWKVRAQKLLKEHPDQFPSPAEAKSKLDGSHAVQLSARDHVFVHCAEPPPEDTRYDEWNNERDDGPGAEGLRGTDERDIDHKLLLERQPLDAPGKVKWEPEPQLTADQIEEIENKIGAGLIEEVIQVAEGELNLVDSMYKAKVWEGLEEQPPEGQWAYFERNSQ
ncbi:hypothetical protein DL766_009664 [Monosporascus sp. MC13-8B]|uniref:NADH-ubiquinone oxidoreductase 299 kDa subunit n=1 Tax=Monosporascus cannonballus TaxID=155416 RepID=A0ABY0HAR0_9PEZI|nr:hypothetical protein DL763_006764 [Monosporascus cannonballus]RYO89106.1 hypothetical protein DL762_003386 [Monosporascus cannonballus]RYP14487.1 hypothetical protein DL766_009664 [Monosporascus sp. MC13-8B]